MAGAACVACVACVAGGVRLARAPTGFRRRGIQAAHHHRTLHQPSQAVGGLATRCDKLALAYQAALHLAAILVWARG